MYCLKLKLVVEDFCFVVSTNRENLSSDTYLGKLIVVGVCGVIIIIISEMISYSRDITR